MLHSLAWPSTILQKRNIIILSEISHENMRKTLDGATKSKWQQPHDFIRFFSQNHEENVQK